MAIAFVQSVGATITGTTTGTTGAITTTPGNLLHISISIYNGSGTLQSIVDNKSNTFGSVVSGSHNLNDLAHYYVENCAGGATHTFTLTLGGLGGYAAFNVSEFSGVATSSAAYNGAFGFDNAPATSHPVSTTGSIASGDLVIGSLGDNSTAGVITVGTGFTETYNNPNVTTTGLEDAYKILGSAGVQTYTPTTAASGTCTMAISGYAAAGGGGGVFIPLIGRGPGMNLAGQGGGLIGRAYAGHRQQQRMRMAHVSR